MPPQLFSPGKAFIGVIHLPLLPGALRWAGNLNVVPEQVERYALTLSEGSIIGGRDCYG